MGNAMITSFTPFDPTLCDKKSRSEHQTLFPLFGEGLGMRLWAHIHRQLVDHYTSQKPNDSAQVATTLVATHFCGFFTLKMVTGPTEVLHTKGDSFKVQASREYIIS